MKYIEFDVVNPDGIVQVYRDYYWWCIDGDPRRALFFGNSIKEGRPQCNYNEDLAKYIGLKLGHDKIAKLIQIHLAFVPWEN